MSGRPLPRARLSTGLPVCRPAVWRLSRAEYAELVAVGVGHDDPADIALADVDTRRPEGDEAVDLSSLITTHRWGDVEMQPVLSGPRRERRAAPRDERTGAVR